MMCVVVAMITGTSTASSNGSTLSAYDSGAFHSGPGRFQSHSIA